MATNLSTALGNPIHQLETRIIYGDTDAGGVVYNANYLRFFEMGRNEFMRALASPYKELEELGFIVPVVESYLRYKAPARYDDLITIKTCLAALTPLTLRFHCHIVHTTSNRLLVKGFTNHAAVDRRGRLAKLPTTVMDSLQTLVVQPE